MLFPSVKSSIENLKSYKPNFGKVKNIKVIRLSANEGALGTSAKAIKAINSFSTDLHRYPPQVSEDLVNAIAKRYSLDRDKIILGNGSDELIAIIAQAYLSSEDEAIYTEYGFLQFPQQISIVGAKGVIAKDNKLTVSVDNILSKINKKTKLVFLANANNPTGTFISKDDIIRLHQGMPSNVLLVYDAAYSEFIIDPDYIDGSYLVNQYDNVIMLRTFSKMHGLASLRLGWGYCSNYILNNLMKVRGPFSVNVAAMIAGKAAIEDIDFQKKSVEHNINWMAWIKKELKKIGLTYQSSVTNFLLIKFPCEKQKTAENAEIFLAKRGILVRNMSGYNLPSYLRVSLGTEEENMIFIKELKSFIDN
ncbi:histidinol-phosphate transaminase [Alphaproteobacteria bacterium]|jgi:histidinol-phosphate aminotransferase|nr:histidinol-phosphate transaminase [Alphaproteobacteria bacterium]|tara:strand:+ start:4057 stop:5145 length:1089 start_codon:yes stop_codon:yes gene_type:complete